MKRKLFVIALAAVSVCVMMSCGSKDGSKEKADAELVAEEVGENEEADAEADDNANAEEEIVAMINDIFDDSDIEYTTNEKGYQEAVIDLTTQFGSKKLCDLVEQVRKIDADKDETEQFIADWNWMLRCFDQGGVEDISVANVDGNKAKVEYWVCNSGMRELYTLALVKEDGQWRVDDVLIMGGQHGSKVKEMKEYIEANQ